MLSIPKRVPGVVVGGDWRRRGGVEKTINQIRRPNLVKAEVKGQNRCCSPRQPPRTNSSAKTAWLLKRKTVVISHRCLSFYFLALVLACQRQKQSERFGSGLCFSPCPLPPALWRHCRSLPCSLRLHLIILGTRWRRAARQQPGNKWAIFSIKRSPLYPPSSQYSRNYTRSSTPRLAWLWKLVCKVAAVAPLQDKHACVLLRRPIEHQLLVLRPKRRRERVYRGEFRGVTDVERVDYLTASICDY